MNLRAEPGFLGTNASMLADLTLLAYILILLPLMAVGYYYARRKMFEPQHKAIMTTITLVNWFLIGFVMVASFTGGVAPNIPDGLGDPFVLYPAIHVVTGLLAQLIATYLLARMWLENQLPSWLKIRNIKIYMRVTLALWVVTALLGILIYFTWYTASPTQADDLGDPVATEELEAAETEDAAEPAAVDDPAETEEAAEAPAETEEAVDDPAETEEAAEAPAETEEAVDDPAETEEAIDDPDATEEP